MNDKEVDKPDEMEANFSFDEMIPPELYKNEPVEAYEDVDDKIKWLAPYEHYDFYNLSPSQINAIKEDLDLLAVSLSVSEIIEADLNTYFAKKLDVDYLIRIINAGNFPLLHEALNIELIRLLKKTQIKPMAREKRAKLVIRRDIEREYLWSGPKKGEIEGVILGIAQRLRLDPEHVKTVIRRGNSERLSTKEFSDVIGVSSSTILRWNKAGEIPQGRNTNGSLTWGWFEVHATRHMKIKSDECKLCDKFGY